MLKSDMNTNRYLEIDQALVERHARDKPKEATPAA